MECSQERLFKMKTANRKNLWILRCSVWVAITVISISTNSAFAQSDAEAVLAGSIEFPATVYTAKRVITMDANNPVATAVAVRGDRILAVGSLDSVKETLGSQPYSVDTTFAQLFMIPGLIEQHLHPILGALTLSIPVVANEAWVLPGKTWPAATN